MAEQFYSIYQTLKKRENASLDLHAMGDRALKNTCLRYLMAIPGHRYVSLAWDHMVGAKTMTDEIAGLMRLVVNDNPKRDEAIQRFYHKWKHEGLVMDKWLSAQALAPVKSIWSDLERLESSDVYNKKIPNKVRALVAVLGRDNLVSFHQEDGRGYRYLVDQIIDIDRINPNIAAYLSKLFNRMGQVDGRRQELMARELNRVIVTDGLSKNTYEIVSKTLELNKRSSR